MTGKRFVVVDHRDLSPEALRGLIEEFVTRQGTDYGLHEATHEDKIRDVERQLDAGEARIVFDFDEERPNIVPRD
ncbi:MAG TPA: YheU family protein [Vicinamibacteria bacterium]|nr:YheU family protein [Vicinamibacteria bacterium]